MNSRWREPTTRLTRRSLVHAVGGGAAGGFTLAALVGCGAAGGQGDGAAAGGQAQQPATIEWYKFLNPEQAQQAEQFLADFHAAHPQTTVQLRLRPGGAVEFMPQLIAMVAGGQAPDVLQIDGTGYTVVALSLAQDISDLYKRDKVNPDRFNRLLFQHGQQWQGKTYGLPFANQAGLVALIYNRNHLRAAGVPEPPERWNDPSWTWERFVDVLKKVVKVGADGKTAVHGLNRLGNFPWVPQSQWGGTWLKDDYQTVSCDSPEVVEAYESFVDLRLKHRVWPQPGESADFRQQNTAFSVLGAWELRQYADLPPEVDWAFAPLPKGTAQAKASPQAYTFDHKIANGARHREHAWMFMRWLTEQSRLAVFEGRPPALREDTSRWTAEIFKNRPNVRPAVATEAYTHAVRPELIWFHPKWASEISGVVTQEFWNPVFAGEKPVAATLREMKPRLQQLMAA
ncbi:MAG: extracellular solute-binding protein [Chloroflexota bacterium]